MRLKLVIPGVLCAASLLHADDYPELFRQAADDTRNGNFDAAILKYKTALEIRPGAPEALNNLAVSYYQVHKYGEAFDLASKIWRNHPELKSAALIAGMAAVQLNRPKDAIAPLEALLSSDPSNRDALLGLASAHFASNDLEHAADIYQREIAAAPKDANAWYGLAICYERLAEDASRKLSRMPRGSHYSKQLLAEYLQSAGNAKLAAEAFGESDASTSAASPEAERQYETARDLADKSRNAFEHFIDLAPDSWQAAVFLGDVERQHGKLTEALAHYQKAADAQPGNPAPLLGLGTTYWEMGDFPHAAACLRDALKANPHATQAIFELGNIAVRQHREAEAIPLLEQYLVAQPNALAARADLGRAYSHLGQYDKAAVELTKASEADERGDVHYQLSIALRKLGRIAEADAALKQSTAIREAQLQHEERQHSAAPRYQ
jgi:tetratricopeptide (TPR) repeat protein